MGIGSAACLVFHGQMDLVGTRDDDCLAGRQSAVVGNDNRVLIAVFDPHGTPDEITVIILLKHVGFRSVLDDGGGREDNTVRPALNGHEHLLAYKHIGAAAFPTLSVAHEFEQFTIGTGGANFHDPVAGRGDAVLPYVPAYATIDVDGRRFTVTWHGQGTSVSQGSFSFTK